MIYDLSVDLCTTQLPQYCSYPHFYEQGWLMFAVLHILAPNSGGPTMTCNEVTIIPVCTLFLPVNTEPSPTNISIILHVQSIIHELTA